MTRGLASTVPFYSFGTSYSRAFENSKDGASANSHEAPWCICATPERPSGIGSRRTFGMHPNLPTRHIHTRVVRQPERPAVVVVDFSRIHLASPLPLHIESTGHYYIRQLQQQHSPSFVRSSYRRYSACCLMLTDSSSQTDSRTSTRQPQTDATRHRALSFQPLISA